MQASTAEGGESCLKTVVWLRCILTNESTALAQRFRALFSLKHLASGSDRDPGTSAAIDAIAAAFTSPSALLKHELAYCLGQTKNVACVRHLRAVLEDDRQDAMCRHEAAEALGAIGDRGSLSLLLRLRDAQSVPEVVRETCEIAAERIAWESTSPDDRSGIPSKFTSIDPAPPLDQKTSTTVEISDLQTTLLDTGLPLFQRYRAMFSLRDLASPPDLPTAVPAVKALSAGLKDASPLFRHEVAFVFGQLSHPASIPSLVETLSDPNETGMVRHEAAEALGSLGDCDGVEETLRRFLHDPEDVVRESIEVALDMARFEKEGGFQYALTPQVAAQAAQSVMLS